MTQVLKRLGRRLRSSSGITTRPRRQGRVGREVNLRIRRGFADARIELR